MNRRELVEKVALRTGLSQAKAHEVLAAMDDEVARALSAGEVVRLGALGSLRPGRLPERVVRSVKDGRRTPVDGRAVLRFRPSQRMLRRLESGQPAVFRDPAHVAAWRIAEALVSDVLAYRNGAPAEIPPALAGATAADAPGGPAFDDAAAVWIGPAWMRARQRFESDVPAIVRERRDHLRDALLRRVPHA